jgi:hypothetical protein
VRDELVAVMEVSRHATTPRGALLKFETRALGRSLWASRTK